MDLFLKTWILLLPTYWTFASEIPCNSTFGVDISDGEILENGVILKNWIRYPPENYKINGTKKLGCICDIKPCLRKCCPFGQFLKNKTCQPAETTFVIPESKGPSLDTFHVINGFGCDPGKSRTILDPEKSKAGRFLVQPDGTIFLPTSKQYRNQMDYCLDYIDVEGEIKSLACTKAKDNVTPSNVIGMIISMPFLLATFIVYALLPDRNLHAKCLMCYVFALFGAYFLLVIIQLKGKDLQDAPCVSLGIFCLFFFMVSFFLMNVMSIDIWWTFSGFRGLSGSRRETEQKRFLLYSGYAWGAPLLLAAVVTTLTLDASSTLWYHPGIATKQCWLTEGFPKLLYFNGPIMILITINVILFVVTAFNIKKVQQDTAVLRKDDSKKHSYEKDKKRFNLFLKLMLAMGINWSMEIISWAVNWQVIQVPKSVWYLTDFLNACYGVFIFIVFVCKQNVWILLKKRYYLIVGKSNSTATMETLVDYAPRITPDSKINNGDKNIATNGPNANISTTEIA